MKLEFKKGAISNIIVLGLVCLGLLCLIFYILCNSNWGLGDDAIIISHTGNGLPFLPSGTICPEIGRFYPFAYLPYNILLLFKQGYISATSHYLINAIFFIVFIIALFILINLIIKNRIQTRLNFWITFFVLIITSQKIYVNFLNLFSTIWLDYTLLSLFLLFCYLFYLKSRWIHAFLSLFFLNYMLYCLEIIFVFPLILGITFFVFGHNNIKQKIFGGLLLFSSGVFITLYYFLVYRHTIAAYDGGHGTNIGLLENALNMFISQKILWLSTIIIIIRMFIIIKKRDKYNIFFDSLLISSMTFMFGAFILKLNWTMYYNLATIQVLPPVIYYTLYYLKVRWCFILFFLFSVYSLYKYPSIIKLNQKERVEMELNMRQVLDYKNKGYKIVWYNIPISSQDYTYNIDLREWRKNSVKTYLSYMTRDNKFKFDTILDSKTIILYPKENYLIKQHSDSKRISLSCIKQNEFYNILVLKCNILNK